MAWPSCLIRDDLRPDKRAPDGRVYDHGAGRDPAYVDQIVRIIRTDHEAWLATRVGHRVSAGRRILVIAIALTVLDDSADQRTQAGSGSCAHRCSLGPAANGGSEDRATRGAVTGSCADGSITARQGQRRYRRPKEQLRIHHLICILLIAYSRKNIRRNLPENSHGLFQATQAIVFSKQPKPVCFDSSKDFPVNRPHPLGCNH